MSEVESPKFLYVCLSDMHFGATNSLFTNLEREGQDNNEQFSTSITHPDITQPSPVLFRLVECLQSLLARQRKKPTLILNGDILELAVATEETATTAFEHFRNLLRLDNRKESLFREVAFIPGNHDHHLWETARERRYVQYLETGERGLQPFPLSHATSLFGRGREQTYQQNSTEDTANDEPEVFYPYDFVHYPNLGRFLEKNRKKHKEKCVLFTHGHYIEPLYMLISTLKTMLFPDRQPPKLIADIEAENFAWIDFFWSALGRSNNNKDDLEALYEQIQDEEQRDRLIARLVQGLTRPLPLIPDALSANVLPKILKALLNNIFVSERNNEVSEWNKERPRLSPEAERGLRSYVSGPLRAQLLEETSDVPNDVTLIFGHTHKPFQQKMEFQGYPESVKVYNSGGWVVDAQAIHGGAVILVDENLHTVSLQVYDEAEDRYEVRAEAAEQSNPLLTWVQGWIAANKPQLDDFSAAVMTAVRLRSRNLERKWGQGWDPDTRAREMRKL